MGWASQLLLAWIALEDIRRRKGNLKGAGFAVFGLLFVPCRWAIHPLVISLWEAPQTTSLEAFVFGLTADLLILIVCAGLALWVHKREVQWLRPGPTGAPGGWWLFSKPAARLIRALACVLIGLSVAKEVRPRFAFNQRQEKYAQQTSTLQALQDHCRAHHPSGPTAQNAPAPVPGPLAVGGFVFHAVSDVSTTSPVCWRLDGTQLCGPAQAPRPAAARGGKRRSLVLSLGLPSSTNDPPWLPFELRIKGKQVASQCTFPNWGSSERHFILFDAPPDATLLDVRVGKPIGDWQDTYVGWECKDSVPTNPDRFLPSRPERFLSLSGQQVQVLLRYLNRVDWTRASAWWDARSLPGEWGGRLVAVDDAGVVHLPSPHWVRLHDTAPGRSYEGIGEEFDGLPSSRIKELRFQVRHCQWIEVRHISLQPGWHSQVEVAEAPVPKAAASAGQPTMPLPSSALSYGPVIQRVLHCRPEDGLIDLDSGEIVTPPPLTNGPSVLEQWVRQHGIDVFAKRASDGQGGYLTGMDLVTSPASSEDLGRRPRPCCVA